jgi:putative CocE/NonD family hydrolase
MEITGPLAVKIWASSSAVDTDFTAKLMDVYPSSGDYPDGYALNLADSIIRTRYSNSREKAEFMSPGKIYKFTIEPQPTANLFKAGHCIRLDISSSNFPQFDVNANTGGPLRTDGRVMGAPNTIYHDAHHPLSYSAACYPCATTVILNSKRNSKTKVIPPCGKWGLSPER